LRYAARAPSVEPLSGQWEQSGEVLDVCYWHLADIDAGSEHVRFRGKADIPN